MNKNKGHHGDKSHICGNWLKPNQRDNCPSRNVFWNSCGRRGNLAKFLKKTGLNHVEWTYDFTQSCDGEDNEELGALAVRTVYEKAGIEK